MNDEQVMHAISLDDAYRVERVLAQGAGGLTELVSIGGTGPFVRKKIPIKLANRGVWSSIGGLDCRRLPKVEATYSLPDLFVVVYDYVPGQTLEELVAGRGRLDAATAAGLALDICEAAAALHSCGVIHRDLSPRNVIVAADGAHLIDLGIARMRVEGATRDTTFLGTRGFASPEQYGFAQTDARSDVYAIGRLLGFMLTGAEPDGENYEELLGDADQVDARLAVCVRRACAFEPSARYQSAEAMAAALRGPGEHAAGAARVEAATVARPAADAAVDAPTGKKPPVKVLVATAVVLLAIVVLVAAALAFGAFGTNDDNGRSTAASVPAATTTTSTSSNATRTSTSGGSSSTNVTAADDLPLEIAETGWSMDSQGYVHYACGLLDTSDDTLVELPGVQIVGYDSSGNVLFTDERGPTVCLPGETTYVTGLNDCGGNLPDRVEFTLKANVATRLRQVTDQVTFSASAVNVRKGDYGAGTFTGTYDIRGSQESLDGLSNYANSTCITLILRDEAGNIVYGENTYQYSLAIGENQPFSIRGTDLPVFATAEAHVSAS